MYCNLNSILGINYPHIIPELNLTNIVRDIIFIIDIKNNFKETI
jgi:hypothetical protein